MSVITFSIIFSSTSIVSNAYEVDRYFLEYPEPATSESQGYAVLMLEDSAGVDYVHTFAWSTSSVTSDGSAGVPPSVGINVSSSKITFNMITSDSSSTGRWCIRLYESLKESGHELSIATNSGTSFSYNYSAFGLTITGFNCNGNVTNIVKSGTFYAPDVTFADNFEIEWIMEIIDTLAQSGEDISSILSKITQIYNSVDTVESKLTTISSYLSTIKTDNAAIKADVDAILAKLNTYLGSLQSSIDKGNDLQEENNALQEENNETTKNIFSSITDFFGSFFQNLIDTIIGVIVPSSEEMSSLFDRLNTFFSNTFDFLYFPFDFIITVFDIFLNSDSSTGLTFPGFSIMGHQVWGNQTYDLADDELVNIILGYVRMGTGGLLAFAFVGYLRNFFEKRFGGGGN